MGMMHFECHDRILARTPRNAFAWFRIILTKTVPRVSAAIKTCRSSASKDKPTNHTFTFVL